MHARDARPDAGDDLVGDGAGDVRPVLRRRAAVGARCRTARRGRRPARSRPARGRRRPGPCRRARRRRGSGRRRARVRRAASCVPDACRGIPSAYPSGTTPSTVSRGVTYWWAYETPVPAGHGLDVGELAPRASSRGPARSRPGRRAAAPARARRPRCRGARGRSGSRGLVSVAAELARCRTSSRDPRPLGERPQGVGEHLGLRLTVGCSGSSANARCDHTPTTSTRPRPRPQRRAGSSVGEVVRREPVAAQPRVDLEVHARGAARGARGRDHLVERPAPRRPTGRCPPRPPRAAAHPGAYSQVRMRGADDARRAQRERLAAPARRRARSRRRRRRPCADGTQPVPVGVGLDDGHHLRGRGVGGEATGRCSGSAARSTTARAGNELTAPSLPLGGAGTSDRQCRQVEPQAGVTTTSARRRSRRRAGRCARRARATTRAPPAGVLPNASCRATSRSRRTSSSRRDEPGLVEQPGHRPEAEVVEQQVVPLDHDERDLGRHGDRARRRGCAGRGGTRGRRPSRRRAPQPRAAARRSPSASNVSGAPLRSARPIRSSSVCARWNPSIGTTTARGPERARPPAAAIVDLPAPGAPAMPSSDAGRERVARRAAGSSARRRRSCVGRVTRRPAAPRSCRAARRPRRARTTGPPGVRAVRGAAVHERRRRRQRRRERRVLVDVVGAARRAAPPAGPRARRRRPPSRATAGASAWV